MTITEITYSEGKTIQENQFEPRSFHYSAKAEVKEGEDLDKAYEELKNFVDKTLNIEVMKWQNPQKYVRQTVNNKLDKPF